MMTQEISATGADRTFERFFEAQYRPLGKAMFLMTGDRADAEDLAQEALTRVYERWERVKLMDSPSGYLFRTAFNLHRKRRRRHRLIPLGRSSFSEDPAASVEAREEVRRLLETVSPSQREALVLVDWLGLDAAEAGRVLGIDAASVRGRLHRARLSLRAQGDPPDE